MSVGVFGCGPIGLLILQLARLAGVNKVLATDILPHRVEAARALGADETYLVRRRASANQEMAMLDTRQGLDVVFEAAGENAAVEMAVAAVRPGGKVILVGIPADDRTSFTASIARRKGLDPQIGAKDEAHLPTRHPAGGEWKSECSVRWSPTHSLSNMRLKPLLLPHGEKV